MSQCKFSYSRLKNLVQHNRVSSKFEQSFSIIGLLMTAKPLGHIQITFSKSVAKFTAVYVGYLSMYLYACCVLLFYATKLHN